MALDFDALYPQAIPLAPSGFERSPMVQEFVVSLGHLPEAARNALLALTFNPRFVRQRHQEGFYEGSLSLLHIEHLCRLLTSLSIDCQEYGLITAVLISNI
jgi:hypothetical protein